MAWNKLAIDISHHQSVAPDLQGAREAGFCAVIHKATESTWPKAIDQKYGARRFLAKEAGMEFGCYHFFRPKVAPKAQVEWFLKYAQPDDRTLVALDHEDFGCSLEAAQEFIEYAERLIGRPLVLYSGHVVREQLEKRGSSPHPFFSKRRLWHAQYSTKLKVHPTWSEPWLWQVSEKGKVPGIKPYTDINSFNGTEDQLRAQWVQSAGV